MDLDLGDLSRYFEGKKLQFSGRYIEKTQKN